MSSLLTFGILQQTKNRLSIIWQGLEYKTVVSDTGATWLDRNLGATRVATAYNDSAAYGHLFQWGRYWDGHEIRTSSTTSTNATTAVPNAGNVWDGLFILESSSPRDWLTPQDNTLWQGVSGTNNPCPPGFRVPTLSEWQAEDNTFSPNSQSGAFASPLKLSAPGRRNYDSGNLFGVGSNAYYWSSSVSGASASYLFVNNFNSATYTNYRAYGFAVRCICDAC